MKAAEKILESIESKLDAYLRKLQATPAPKETK